MPSGIPKSWINSMLVGACVGAGAAALVAVAVAIGMAAGT